MRRKEIHGRTLSERGQTLILFVMALAVILGFVAMTVDVGLFLQQRRDLQNDADAAALAGAAFLPDSDMATQKAQEWAGKNFDDGNELVTSIEVSSYREPNDRITVSVEQEVSFVFGRVLGLVSDTVPATATAGRVPVIAACISPWGVQGVVNDAALDFGLAPEDLFVFELSSSDWETPGNYGALGAYGGGTSAYRNAIAGNCGEVVACDSDSPLVAEGETLACNSQTGSLGQNTNDALTERYPPSTWAACDVQTDANGHANAVVKASQPGCRDRAVAIAIIDAFPPQGQSADVQIWGLATFYIAGWDRWPPVGTGDLDGDPASGMVWGYLVPDTALPAWTVSWGWDSSNPFAPLVIVLVK
ncbi:MAG: pilus assembly protein TadG-related protein [Dehalococcoidia bacterium]